MNSPNIIAILDENKKNEASHLSELSRQVYSVALISTVLATGFHVVIVIAIPGSASLPVPP